MFVLFAILFFGFIFYYTGKKRSEHTHRCPNCGTICNASRWSTGVMHSDGRPVHSYKCPNCGHSFMD